MPKLSFQPAHTKFCLGNELGKGEEQVQSTYLARLPHSSELAWLV